MPKEIGLDCTIDTLRRELYGLRLYARIVWQNKDKALVTLLGYKAGQKRTKERIKELERDIKILERKK